MQVLCIASGTSSEGVIFHPRKGEVYNSLEVGPIATHLHPWPNIINAWHVLEEGGDGDVFHVSLFIDLPKEEGLEFSKKIEELIEA